MKKIIYLTILLATILTTSCARKEPKIVTLAEKPKDLIGKEFPLWYAEGTNIDRFGMGFTQYGESRWKISFIEGKAGLYYLPDSTALDEDKKPLPGDQYIPAKMTETYVDRGNGPVSVIRMEFPLPNKDLSITQGRKIPTAWISGDYLFMQDYADGQDAYLLTKVDGSNRIMLLNR